MSKLRIVDLDESRELDREAMSTIVGGARQSPFPTRRMRAGSPIGPRPSGWIA